MKNLKIASINLRNNETNRISKKNKENAQIVASIILHKQFDIVGTQELTRSFQKQISKNLKDYQFYGKYRFGKLLKLPEKQDFNENNNILTNKKVEEINTFHLPWIPNNKKELKYSIIERVLLPRIVTIGILKIKEQSICIINTHLSNRLKSVQQRQLDYLLNKIEELQKKYPVILMGDFNMGIDKNHFLEFVRKLKEKNLKRVEINEKTHEKLKTSIDHIFIPERWGVLQKGTISHPKIDQVTDHKGIYVEVEIK